MPARGGAAAAARRRRAPSRSRRAVMPASRPRHPKRGPEEIQRAETNRLPVQELSFAPCTWHQEGEGNQVVLEQAQFLGWGGGDDDARPAAPERAEPGSPQAGEVGERRPGAKAREEELPRVGRGGCGRENEGGRRVEGGHARDRRRSLPYEPSAPSVAVASSGRRALGAGAAQALGAADVAAPPRCAGARGSPSGRGGDTDVIAVELPVRRRGS